MEADALEHTAGQQGQAQPGGKKPLGRRPRGRRTPREPGRGHDDKDRPAIMAWVSRQGTGVLQATKDCTVKTVQKAADLAVQPTFKESGCTTRFLLGRDTLLWDATLLRDEAVEPSDDRRCLMALAVQQRRPVAHVPLRLGV